MRALANVGASWPAWLTVLLTLAAVAVAWLAYRQSGVGVGLRRGPGRKRISTVGEDVVATYEARQSQLEQQIDDLTKRLQTAEQTIEVLRKEVQALPAIQALTKITEEGFAAVLEAIGGTT